MFDPTALPLALLGLFAFGGLATYTISDRRRQARGHRQAPKQVRRTALWSIYMGQMAVPGGALGLFGVLFGAGLGLVSIPGMILAVRIWRLGYALVRGDAGAASEARKLARFAIVLNAVAVALGWVLLAAGGVELAPLTAVLTVYGAVSFAHAKAMRRSADLLDADRQARQRAPGARVGGHPSVAAAT